ncbi:MAG: YhdP family protein [Pseudomonadota bacterium]
MHNPNPDPAPTHVPLAIRWRRARAAYRLANLATHHVLGFTVKLVLLAYFLFALTFLALRYLVLPHIDVYKGDIERLASRAVGNQVAIARIYASWSGLRPNLFLGDVTLRDKAGRQVLSLPSVSATLSWWSLAALDVRFESLEIIRPDLDIRRDLDGRLYVAGMLLDQKKGDSKGADWALSQRLMVVREGRLHWTDQLRGAPELALDNVNLLLRNQWNDHEFAVTATPPAALGKPLDLRAAFVHPRFASRISDVALWKGELFADLRETDLAAWKAYVDYPFQVSQGKGSLRAWLTLDQAKLAGFTADVALAGVNARLGPDLPPLNLMRVTGRLSAREDFPPGLAEGTPTYGIYGHTIALTDFAIQTAEGVQLPATTMSETFKPAKDGKPEQTVIKASQLDLETLAEVAEQLPLSASQRQMLDDLAPRGRLVDFSAQWQGKYPAVTSYHLTGKVAGLGMKAQPPRLAVPKTATAPAQAAVPAIPGFENLTGSVDATEKGGSFSLDSTKLVLQLPSWFTDPAMPFDQFIMQARWNLEQQDQFQFQVDSLRFVQGQMIGTLKGKHKKPLTAQGQLLGEIDMEATLTGLKINTLDKYLPLQTPHELRLWLTTALEDGMLQDTTIKLRGDLSHFPFKTDATNGEFHVAGRIENGKLNYVPSQLAKDGKAPLWPQAEHINGSIVFDRARMEIKGDTARTGGVGLANVKAVVPDLSAHDMMLDIDGSASGPMQEYVNYVAASPVLEWIGHFTEDTHATGNARLGLKLHIPLSHPIDTRVGGVLQLAGNEVILFPDLPPVTAAQGKIEFNERGVNLNGTSGSFLGGSLALSGGTQKDNAIVIKLAGSITGEGLRKAYPAAAMQRVTSRINGSARFAGAVVAREHQVTVTVDSTLAGLGLDLPVPVKKAAPEALPLHFVLTSPPTGEGGLARDDIRITLGSTMGARYQRQRQGKGPWTVVRGGIGVNAPPPEPDSGLMVNVSLKSLNIDHWTALGSGVTGKGEAGGGTGTDLTPYVVPDTMAAHATELIIGDRKIDNVVVGVSRQKGTWQANIDSHQASGYLTWNESSSGAGLGKVTARLATLIIPESAAADVKDLLEGSKAAASSIPALDIVAERFELFNKPLGRLELVANNTLVAQAREWRINKLLLANPDGELKGTGKWAIREGQSSTSFNFTLDIADAGKLLDRFGFPETLRKGKGKLSGDIAWNGLPYTLDIPSLSGKIDMNVEAGQFLKQDPGAAKLLGVLSLQALPRLLKLDFHDVFSEGLAFDGITASAVIARGVAKTDNLKMHGVAATVLMDGTADIANETTNLHVVVIPEFNLGTGPLVYALAVNPVIGLGSFLAQLFLRAPVMKALTYQMQIAGPWKAPIVTKLDNGKLEIPPPKKTP